MNILNIENVTKVYGDKVLLQDVSLGINEGDKIGVIGVNGCGKSTFLKMIAGLSIPDSGNIIKNNQASIAYLAQNTEFDPQDTILRYVTKDKVSSNPNWNIEAEAKTILRKLGIYDENVAIAPLSGGEKKRVALARTLLAPADILILDEPTNHLDSGMVRWIEEYLGKFKGVLIMVTHDRYFLDRVTNKIVEIDRGSLYSYDANFSGYLELKQARLDQQAASYRKVQSILRTEIEWVRRGAQARSTKQKARLERFEQMQNMKAPEQDKQVEMDSLASRLGKKTIELEHISKAYDGRTLISDFTYYTIRNERIGIVGPNGCGKTTLLKIILGLEQPDNGSVTIGETIQIGYFSQMVEDMNPEERVIDYVKNVAEYIKTSKGTTSASQMCERFLFGPETQYNPIGKLSGGEKRRLYLLKVLMAAPNVLILDEPTNDLDITTLAVLEEYLDYFEGIVITVSHDRYFLDRVVNRIFAFEGNGVITQYEGGYTDYLEKAIATGKLNDSVSVSGEAVAGKEPAKDKTDSRQTWKNNREKKLKFTYQEQREYDTIDADIADLEEKIANIDAAVLDAASDYTKLSELTQKKEELEKQLEEKMDRWVYLNDLAEQIANAK
ncbi:MAG: ABC-F family ATP-binding cassette domain-containing protein [Lachnospiraceae bacterium]|nr:ABC-F family ATP-binding cassette domain-containing protein [Lachnospiraceae bacterium]HCJ07693.1 ABC transporter ATP-binding protein [Lachnospiraceae bacterium]